MGQPGLTTGSGVQQTPVPVPVTPQYQTQAPSQHNPGPVPILGAPAAGTATTATTVLNARAVASPVPPAGAQLSKAPPQQQTQPSKASVHQQSPSMPGASIAVARTPIPAPMRPVVQVPSSVPLVVPRQDDSPSATTESRRPDAPGPSELEIPKVEPLTPPLGPVRFPPPRQSHAYPNHPERQASIDPPAPEPIEFDDNPDVLAMRSAISLLQMQRVRAKNDMKALQKAKEAALADPEAFIKDLSSGKIKMGGSGLGSSMGDDYDEDDDDDSDDDSEDAEQDGVKNESGSTNIDKKPKRNKPELKPWSRLPSKQNVVRMPHINWSQYSVAGGSLDRLHNEQVSHPSQGTPATVGADGAYVFQGTGRQEEYRGIAAPYDPLKDKLIKKPKSKAPNRQG